MTFLIAGSPINAYYINPIIYKSLFHIRIHKLTTPYFNHTLLRFLEKGTFISSLSDCEEEYYLSKNTWSGVAADWKQRFEVGDVVNDPAGDWDPSTAEAYIDQQIATEAATRLAQDNYIQSQIPIADEEDLTKSGSYLKFKDRIYNQVSPNGMGRVILRNNIVDGVNTLTQSMMSQQNTIYVIQYDFTLGEDITVPANCILEFDGGSINGNGTGKDTITGNNTSIISDNNNIFSNVIFSGTFLLSEISADWFDTLNSAVQLANLKGGIVKLSNKVYNTSTPIVINHPGVIIEGCSFNAWRNSDYGSTIHNQVSDVIQISATNVCIKNLKIINAGSYNGINLIESNFSTLENLSIMYSGNGILFHYAHLRYSLLYEG